jgi:phage terminase small subunit
VERDAVFSNLTPKQQRFVREFLLDLNATQAAIRAGYSARTADKQGPRLLSNPCVAAAIDAAKAERLNRTKVDSDLVLRRLFEQAEADLADIFDANNDLKPIDAWPDVWRRGLVAGVEINALFDGTGKDRIQVGHIKKIRLADRIRIIELIGKHIKVNAFQETVNHTGLDALGDRLERALKRGTDHAVIEVTALADIVVEQSETLPHPIRDSNFGDRQHADDSGLRSLESPAATK